MYWVIIVLAALAALVVWGSRLAYRLVFYNLNEMEKDPYVVPPGKQYEMIADDMLRKIAELDGEEYDLRVITARDGTKLAARYYHFRDGAPLQIQFHGYRGHAVRDFCGGYQIAKKMGMNALVIDERAHGRSGGHTITFGIRERYDCVDWVNYACSVFGKDVPILLSGVSMGAATVLMASDLELPDNVRGITADCPYSAPGQIIRKVCRDMKMPAALLYPFVVLGALLFGHFKLWESSAVEAVKNTKIPILLVHGQDDLFVPCSMSREIYEACAGPKFFYTIPEAGHGLSYLVDPEKYEGAVSEFVGLVGLFQ